MTAARAPGKHHGGRGRIIDLSNRTFGLLSVVRRLGPAEARALGTLATGAHWLCRCACGTEKPVIGRSLCTGKTRSCGSRACRGAL